MTALRKKKSVTELAAIPQQLYDNFNGREVDDERIDLPEFRKITAVETQIENATFGTDAERLAGLKILFELNDARERPGRKPRACFAGARTAAPKCFSKFQFNGGGG